MTPEEQHIFNTVKKVASETFCEVHQAYPVFYESDNRLTPSYCCSNLAVKFSKAFDRELLKLTKNEA